jgi:hypothetical protein
MYVLEIRTPGTKSLVFLKHLFIGKNKNFTGGNNNFYFDAILLAYISGSD